MEWGDVRVFLAVMRKGLWGSGPKPWREPSNGGAADKGA
jgi:hypothetical protein